MMEVLQQMPSPRALAVTRLCQKRLAGLDMRRSLARGKFIPTDDDVDIERIELDAAANAASLLGGDEGRARAEERVDDDVAPVGQVQQRVLDHRGRLDGRMVLKAWGGVGAKRGGAGIGPDVRAPAPAFAELDLVDVRGGAV